MQRDLKLIREILLAIEKKEDFSTVIFSDTDISEEITQYHSWLLIDAGLIEGIVEEDAGGGKYCFLINLTWKGHEFLSSIREDTVFNKVNNTLKPLGGFTMEILKEVASSAAKQVLGLP